MYFSITTKDKEGSNPAAVLVLADQYGKTIPTIPKADIIIEKPKVFGEPNLLKTFRENCQGDFILKL